MRTATAGRSGLLGVGVDHRQGASDWTEHSGPVEAEPVAGHRLEFGERGDESGVGDHDAGGDTRGDGRIGGREREAAKRTTEALAGLEQLR